jgi:hypothetical protein
MEMDAAEFGTRVADVEKRDELEKLEIVSRKLIADLEKTWVLRNRSFELSEFL